MPGNKATFQYGINIFANTKQARGALLLLNKLLGVGGLSGSAAFLTRRLAGVGVALFGIYTTAKLLADVFRQTVTQSLALERVFNRIRFGGTRNAPSLLRTAYQIGGQPGAETPLGAMSVADIIRQRGFSTAGTQQLMQAAATQATIFAAQEPMKNAQQDAAAVMAATLNVESMRNATVASILRMNNLLFRLRESFPDAFDQITDLLSKLPTQFVEHLSPAGITRIAAIMSVLGPTGADTFQTALTKMITMTARGGRTGIAGLVLSRMFSPSARGALAGGPAVFRLNERYRKMLETDPAQVFLDLYKNVARSIGPNATADQIRTQLQAQFGKETASIAILLATQTNTLKRVTTAAQAATDAVSDGRGVHQSLQTFSGSWANFSAAVSGFFQQLGTALDMFAPVMNTLASAVRDYTAFLHTQVFIPLPNKATGNAFEDFFTGGFARRADILQTSQQLLAAHPARIADVRRYTFDMSHLAQLIGQYQGLPVTDIVDRNKLAAEMAGIDRDIHITLKLDGTVVSKHVIKHATRSLNNSAAALTTGSGTSVHTNKSAFGGAS